MASKIVLILGGGIGGIVTANELRRLLPKEHRIILIEKNIQHEFAPSFLWLMTGDRKKEQITRNFTELVKPGVEVFQEIVVTIDPSNRVVQTDGNHFEFDYLVIALGAELAPETIPGLDESAHTYYTLEGANKLHQVLQEFQGGKVAVVVSSLPYKCPGAPHEGAMLIADYLNQRNLKNRAEVHLFTPEPLPMPVAGPKLGEMVEGMLQGKGVSFHPLHKLAKVDSRRRELSFEGKEPIPYDLLVAIPPHRSPQVVRDSTLANPAGWIPVDRATLKTGVENIYALGDVTAVTIPGRWKSDVPLMLPKAGVFAHAQAQAVSSQIAADITGILSPSKFVGYGYCMLESGENKAGFAYGDFYSEPSPKINLYHNGRTWHLGKVLFEQWWLSKPGLKRDALQLAMILGSKILGIQIVG
jgi:sulfide:quinone oxidoreductase